MRKIKVILLIQVVSIIILTTLMLYSIKSFEHKCIDSMHIKCDGNCECDGLNCR